MTLSFIELRPPLPPYALLQFFHAPPFPPMQMDADHSAAFALWYTRSVLDTALRKHAALRRDAPFAFSVHDVYDTEILGQPVSEEGKVVLRWLPAVQASSKACLLMNPLHNDGPLLALQAIRTRVLGSALAPLIWGYNNAESMLFVSIAPK